MAAGSPGSPFTQQTKQCHSVPTPLAPVAQPAIITLLLGSPHSSRQGFEFVCAPHNYCFMSTINKTWGKEKAHNTGHTCREFMQSTPGQGFKTQPDRKGSFAKGPKVVSTTHKKIRHRLIAATLVVHFIGHRIGKEKVGIQTPTRRQMHMGHYLYVLYARAKKRELPGLEPTQNNSLTTPL